MSILLHCITDLRSAKTVITIIKRQRPLKGIYVPPKVWSKIHEELDPDNVSGYSSIIVRDVRIWVNSSNSYACVEE